MDGQCTEWGSPRMGSVPSVLPPQLPCPLSGVGAVYLGIQVITQFLSIFLLYSWWGELSVSEGPLKDLVGVSGSPEPQYRPSPRDDLNSSSYPPNRPSSPARNTHQSREPCPLTVHDGAAHSGVVAVKFPHQSPRLPVGDLPIKLLPEAPDALLQLGWGQRGSERGRRTIAPPYF